MKFKLLLLLLISVFVTTHSFALNSKLTQPDNEALSWLIVLNKNEIAAAKETLKKSKNPLNRKFADLMIKDHTKNLRQTLKFNPTLAAHPAETKALEKLKQEGKDLMDTLANLNGKEYDAEYIHAMVKGHASALETLDSEFLSTVNSQKLKKHLETTREHIVHHFEEAKMISANLDK